MQKIIILIYLLLVHKSIFMSKSIKTLTSYDGIVMCVEKTRGQLRSTQLTLAPCTGLFNPHGEYTCVKIEA